MHAGLLQALPECVAELIRVTAVSFSFCEAFFSTRISLSYDLCKIIMIFSFLQPIQGAPLAPADVVGRRIAMLYSLVDGGTAFFAGTVTKRIPRKVGCLHLSHNVRRSCSKTYNTYKTCPWVLTSALHWMWIRKGPLADCIGRGIIPSGARTDTL